MKNIFSFLIILVPLFTFSQMNISFGQKIEVPEVDLRSKFMVLDNNGFELFNGGNINDFVFEKPGNYIIHVNEFIDHNKKTCQHSHLPEKIEVIVSDYHIDFDTSSIKLSEEIIKNKNVNGIKLFVDVIVKTFDGSDFNMNKENIKSAGIGTTIIGSLDKDFYHLSNGKHRICYHLEGIANQESYIMFDFLEPNGNIQAIALSKPIKN
jgi:hypothetical protein